MIFSTLAIFFGIPTRCLNLAGISDFHVYFFIAPFLQMPGPLDSSELALFYPKVRGLPRSFAWLTGVS